MSNSKNGNGQLKDSSAATDLSNAPQLRVKLLDKDGQAKIFLQLLDNSANYANDELVTIAEQGLELPVSLLPALKRSLAEIEQVIVSEHPELTFPDEMENEDNPINHRPASFAHESEQEFAQILDFYQIEWLYEPCTFAIRWDDAGNVVESFTPDFYLPEQDQYIELTTLKQELVTKKNRKVRLLKSLYPGIGIKIIYGKDYRRLLEKYATKVEKKEESPK